MKLETIEPGNGSSYRLGLFEMDTKRDFVICWIRSENSGPCFSFKAHDSFNLDYICDKMGISPSDAVPIMQLVTARFPLVITDLSQWQAILGSSVGST